MSQVLNLKIKGLYTNANQLSEVPEGALSTADNIVIDKESVAQSRRGFEGLTNLGNSADRVNQMTSFQGKLIAHRQNDDTLMYYDSNTWTNYSGTIANPDDNLARIKFAPQNGNLYFTTSSGIKMLDVYNGSIYSTGIPKGLDGEASLTGGSGFMPDDSQVAYRIVWGARDLNNNLYLGAPSQRIIIANSAGATRDVSLTFTIPAGITTDDFFQIYRSGASADANTEPNDELQLVYEANPTSGQITAKSITLTDSTPDSLRGAFLYTNANQEGIAESNDIPPYAKDITPFKNHMFFGNVKTKDGIFIKLLAVGGSGLVADDTITIDGVTYTAKSSETVASAQFKVFTGGSASQNIDDTAKSLCKVINQYSSNTSIYAYYVTGYSDLPGQIYLEARSLDDSFSVSVSRAAAWDIGQGTSENNEYQHGIMWSKVNQPEHVPSAHLEFVGSKNSPIRRIIPLKDSLFILKDDGVFRLTGNGGVWSVEDFDISTKILAPDSAVVLNNQIFALTDQGVCTISDLGVAVISRPIENEISSLFGDALTPLKYYSFGVSYETDRKYILWAVSSSSDTYPTQAFIYNTFTRAWTRWTKEAKSGFVNPADDRLYISLPDENKVLKERKSFTYADYVDELLLSPTLFSYSGTTVTLSSVAGVSAGDLLYQSASLFSVILEVNDQANTVTIYEKKAWNTAASCSVFKGIDCALEWVNQAAGNPGLEKHWTEASVLFREQKFSEATVSFYTDLLGGYSDVEVAGQYGGGRWGTFTWGALPWGGVVRPRPVRVFIPRDKARGTLLSVKYGIRQAYSQWSVNGISVFFEQVSERVNRN